MINFLIKEVHAAPFNIEKAPGTDIATIGGLEGVFGNVITVALAIGGVALFIMLILGGFKYLTSGADMKAVQGAKSTLTYAIAGIVLMAVAYLILLFIANVTGVRGILNFEITP